MRAALIISVSLAVVTSIITWVPWGRAASSGAGTQATLLTTTGKTVAPESVADLRVATYDANERAPKVFAVARKNNKWVIPSHFDYPADAGSKVGETAGAVLNLQRGPVVSARKEDHAALGVVDPLADDLTATADARGRRITLKDESGATLVDLIIGKAPPGQGDLHYVRTVGSDEVVTAQVNVNSVSTTFRDWVEADPLKLDRSAIRQLAVRDYSVSERQGTVTERSQTQIDRTDAKWSSPQTPAGQQIRQAEVDAVLNELTGLKLVGVRPFDPDWLSRRGFYVARKPDGGYEIYGNEGELNVVTNDGLRYRLFFGEIAVGDEQDTAADNGAGPTTKPVSGNNRYMAIFADYDPAADRRNAPPPGTKPSTQPAPGPTTQQVEQGKLAAQQKMERFTRFFYVIGNDSFEKLRPEQKALFETVPAPATAPTTAPSALPTP